MNCREKFYEVLFSIDSKLVPQFKQLFADINKSDEIEFKPIGTVNDQAEFNYGDLKMSLNELKQNYRQGWGEHIGLS